MLTRLILALVLLASAACAVPASDAPTSAADEARAGRLVIIGGALDAGNAAVFHAILEARDGDGPVCVIPTAGGDPIASMESMVERLEGYAGEGSALGIPISTESPELAVDSAVVQQIGACSGFYFTGGSQSRVVDVFLPGRDTTPAYRALRDRWRSGAVLAGSSAGAAMMSQVMIASGNPASAVANGTAQAEDGEGVFITEGMGFFTRAMLDQHFLARGRIGRLLVATLATDSLPLGIGVDENTALVVDGDTAVVVGASGVVLVDARGAERQGTTRATGIRVALAGDGDVLDLDAFRVRRGDSKQDVPEGNAAPTHPEDPLARWAFLHVVTALASSPDGQATFELDDATLTVTEADGFQAWMHEAGGGVEGAPRGFGAGPWVVDLVD